VLDVAALLFLTKFTRKPLRFFGLLGGIEFLFGIAICGWLVAEFVRGVDQSELRNRAALIFGVLLIVLGVQTFFIGFVAEIIIFTQARNLKDYKVDRYEGGPPHENRELLASYVANLPAGDGAKEAVERTGAKRARLELEAQGGQTPKREGSRTSP